jgi:hypothetical protein
LQLTGILRNADPTENTMRVTNRCLSGLLGRGLVTRLSHVDPDGDIRRGKYVYGLSDRGVSYAFENSFDTPSTKSLDEHSRRTLPHELAISDFHIAMRRHFGHRLYWRQTGLDSGVRPDALIVLDRGDSELPFFLEMERAKFGNYRDGEPQIVRKLMKYLKHYDSKECERDWGFRQFRVLVIVPNERRKLTLLAKLKPAAHRMFWVATEEDAFRRTAGEIFATPKDFEASSYSFSSVL